MRTPDHAAALANNMSSLSGATRRWLTAMPMTYSDDPAFWTREVGLLCLGFRKAGLDSRFVALGTPSVRDDPPLILGTMDNFRDPKWWSQWQAEGVFLTSFGAPRFEGIARAIKQSGALLAIRLDSPGIPSPRVNFRGFLQIAYGLAKDKGQRFAAPYAVAKTLLFRFSPRAFDAGFCQHLSHADFIIIESPLAQQALCRYLTLVGHGHLGERIRVLPHQTVDGLQYNPAIQKAPRLVAVGRWQAYQKDAPLLMKVLGTVLPHWPAYEAVLFGSGRERLESLSRGLPESIRARIKVKGPMAHAALCQEYQAAQVMFFSSRFEGFPVAAGEALSCGCSVVGAATLPSMNFICSQDSGTLAASRNYADMANALACEFDLWSRGRRDPAKISQAWQDRVSVSAIVRKFLEYVSQEKSRPNQVRDA